MNVRGFLAVLRAVWGGWEPDAYRGLRTPLRALWTVVFAVRVLRLAR